MSQEQGTKPLRKHLSPDEINAGTHAEFMKVLEEARRREEGPEGEVEYTSETPSPTIVKIEPKA